MTNNIYYRTICQPTRSFFDTLPERTLDKEVHVCYTWCAGFGQCRTQGVRSVPLDVNVNRKVPHLIAEK